MNSLISFLIKILFLRNFFSFLNLKTIKLFCFRLSLVVAFYTKCRNKCLLEWLTITKQSTFVLSKKGHISQIHILKWGFALSANHQFGLWRSNLFQKVRFSKFWVICSVLLFPYQWNVCSFLSKVCTDSTWIIRKNVGWLL